MDFRSAERNLEFGLPPNGIHYKRLADGFKRVFGSTIFFGTESEMEKGSVWECGRGHFFDQMHAWFLCTRNGAEPLTGDYSFLHEAMVLLDDVVHVPRRWTAALAS